MRITKVALSVLFLALFCSLLTNAEVIQLRGVSTEVKPDTDLQYNAQALMEIQAIKSVLIAFVNSPISSKAKYVSPKYKSIFKNTDEVLSVVFNKEAYLKLDIRRIEYFYPRVSLKADLYWAMEGYEGVQTFHFMFTKENGKWLIDWMVY